MPKKKYQGEAFSTTAIPGCNGVHYYTPKIVGVNFKSNLKPSRSRRSVISLFLNLSEKFVSLSANDQTRVEVIKAVEQDKVWHLREAIQRHIKLVPEPDNKYDPNAIAVFVSMGAGHGYIDVGYIPKDHAKVIKEFYPKFFLIGARKEGAGLRLDMILYERGVTVNDLSEEPVVEIPVQEKIQPTFLSLKKIRRSLEM